MFQTDKTQRSERVPLNRVRIRDDFWSYYIGLVRDVVVPYQWEALNDRVESAEPSGASAISGSRPGLSKGISTEWCFRTVTWRNGWKRCLTYWKRMQIRSWKKPPTG